MIGFVYVRRSADSSDASTLAIDTTPTMLGKPRRRPLRAGDLLTRAVDRVSTAYDTLLPRGGCVVLSRDVFGSFMPDIQTSIEVRTVEDCAFGRPLLW